MKACDWLLVTALSAAALMPLGAAAATLGRLFTTPDERAKLEQIRNDPNYGKTPAKAPPPVESTVDKAPSVPRVTVNGVVLRRAGGDVVWINGHEVGSDEPTPEGLRVHTYARRGTVRIVLPDGNETEAMKPGQRIDVLTGKILDAYQQRVRKEAPRAFDEARANPSPPVADDAAAPRAPSPPKLDAGLPDGAPGAAATTN